MSTPNPYAAPKAPVADATPGLPGNFVPSGRIVPPGRGWTWIAQGWDLFKRQPAMWIALIVVALVIFIVLSFIPVIGAIALVILGPVFAGGLVIAARTEDQGGELEIGQLFAGFRERLGPLATVGVLYLVAMVVIAVIAGLITGAGMWGFLGSGGDAAALGAGMLSMLLGFLVMLALTIPVAMAVWFAPPLVVFHDQGAIEAMRQSFFACLKNIIPFLIYGVILFVAAIVATIPFMLGWLVLGPVMAASLYTAYRDIFFQ